jgi:acetyl-CoA acetyltransferase
VGETDYVRGTDKSELEQCVKAALAACADAGVEPSALDGLVLPGLGPRVEDLVNALGIRDLRWSGRVEMGGASSVAALGLAAAALETGRASRVVIATSWNAYSGARVGAGGESLLREHARLFPSPLLRTEIEHPQGLLVPMQYYSIHATRWMHEYDVDPEGMAVVALTMRQHAQLNSRAYMRGREMSREDYLGSPLVCSPLRLFDCCLETDGGAAVVLCARDHDIGPRSVVVLSATEGHPDSPDDVVSRADPLQMGITKAAPRAFEAAGVGPEDVDVAELYDCFTFIVLRQLEEIGFCARGDSTRFVLEDGIGLGGRLPVNTHGGLLSQAHVSGMNHLVEGVRQLRGEAGSAQVPNARIAIVTGYGDFGDGSMAVLGRG